MPRAPSIRRRLLWLLLALAGAWSTAAVLTYFDAHREVDALLDAHLRQSARLLVAQAELDLDEIELDEDDDDYGTDVAFQVRRTEGNVLLRSAKAPDEPFASATRGFSDVIAGAREWRVYTMLDEHGATVVHFAEDHATRERIARRMALRALGPMLALLPVLGFAIWWTVGRSLRPLDRLGSNVETNSI